MRTRPVTALLALLAALLGALAPAAPAAAAEQVVTITADGLSPQVLEVVAGDTVAFVNGSALLGFRAQATTGNWDLDSGAALALPGGRHAHPTPITEPGSYGFRVADGEQYVGTVVLRVVAQPTPPPPEPGQPVPPPGPAAPPVAPAPGQPAPAPAPAAAGGTGTTGVPQLGPGLGSLGTLPSPVAEGVAPPPAIALPELPGATTGPLPQTAAADAPRAVAFGPGLLPSPPTLRGYGLPSAVAAVLAAGVVSLLVRLLLAEPAARRRTPRPAGRTAVATGG